jgi:hypothetical protein
MLLLLLLLLLLPAARCCLREYVSGKAMVAQVIGEYSGE